MYSKVRLCGLIFSRSPSAMMRGHAVKSCPKFYITTRPGAVLARQLHVSRVAAHNTHFGPFKSNIQRRRVRKLKKPMGLCHCVDSWFTIFKLIFPTRRSWNGSEWVLSRHLRNTPIPPQTRARCPSRIALSIRKRRHMTHRKLRSSLMRSCSPTSGKGC